MDIHNASPNVSSDQNNDLKGGREVYGLNDEINDYGSSPKKNQVISSSRPMNNENQLNLNMIYISGKFIVMLLHFGHQLHY